MKTHTRNSLCIKYSFQKTLILLSLFLIFFSCTKNSEAEHLAVHKTYLDSLLQTGKKMADAEDYKKAYAIINTAKDGYVDLEDTASMVKCLSEMAIIQEYESDFLGSIETGLSALNSAKNLKLDHQTLYNIYNNLGVNSTNLYNFKDAKKFYKQAFNYTTDSLSLLKLKHNLGVVYYKEKNYKAAEQIQKNLLNQIKKKNATYYKIAIHHARYKSFLDAQYNPQPIFQEAINYCKNKNDLWGLDACYFYASEYYFHRNKDSALSYANKNYEVATELNATVDRIDALKNIIKLEPQSKQYFEKYSVLLDSMMININASKNQFAVIRFESEKNLNEKLKLQNEISTKNTQMLLGSIAMLFFISGGFVLYKNRQKKLKTSAENKIKEDRFIISKKVHDVVANGIYRVMSSLEHQEKFDKEEVLDQLDNMYQKSRDISHDQFESYQNTNIQTQISELAASFQNSDMHIFTVGNQIETWQNIPSNLRKEIYDVILELFINTKKHSKATKIILKFESKDQHFRIQYIDNGIGLGKTFVQGMGLTSISKKILKANGEINFETPDDKQGFFALIKFNLNNSSPIC